VDVFEDGEIAGLQPLVEGVVEMQNVGGLEVPSVGSRLE